MTLAPVVTPHGVLTVRRSGDVALLESYLGSRLEQVERLCVWGLDDLNREISECHVLFLPAPIRKRPPIGF